MKEKIADLSRKSHPIRVVSGELLKQDDLDVIVSFLTDDLSWGGPVNQKLITAVGHLLDEYVLTTVVKPQPGDAFSTPAFNAPCKQLIFGIIPKWDAGLMGEEKHLKRAIKNILQLAEKKGYSTIGIPAMGGSQNDIPLNKSARIISNALRELNLSPFTEIRLVCKSKEVFEAYRERFEAGI